MAKKYRNAQSYYGNTAEARKNQRANLIPGNAWDKRNRKRLRLDCYWGEIHFKDKQDIYECWNNERLLKDTPKEELKDEKYLETWWEELTIEEKEQVYKWDISRLTKKAKLELTKDIRLSLEKKIKEERKARKKIYGV